MAFYTVLWEIELDAENPEEAANIAKNIQLDIDSEANTFIVIDENKQAVQVNLITFDDSTLH